MFYVVCSVLFFTYSLVVKTVFEMKHSSRKPHLKAPDKTEQMACIQLLWTSAKNTRSLLFSPTQTSLPFVVLRISWQKSPYQMFKCFKRVRYLQFLTFIGIDSPCKNILVEIRNEICWLNFRKEFKPNYEYTQSLVLKVSSCKAIWLSEECSTHFLFGILKHFKIGKN